MILQNTYSCPPPPVTSRVRVSAFTLAGGIMPRSLFVNTRKCAFTLAEVLITLGIIGIVAALTIPSLIARNEKIQQVTALKKFYASFQNGVKLMLADTNCEDIKCLGFFDGPTSNPQWNDQMEQAVKKYFKVVKVCKYGDTSCARKAYSLMGTERPNEFRANQFHYITADGTLVRIEPLADYEEDDKSLVKNNLSKIKYRMGVCVDLNGEKKPNTLGKDIFYFQMAQDGTLYPLKGIEFAKYMSGNNWASSAYYWKTNNSMLCSKTSTYPINSGDGCAARIIEEGWEMNY